MIAAEEEVQDARTMDPKDLMIKLWNILLERIQSMLGHARKLS